MVALVTTQTRPHLAGVSPYHGGSGAQTTFDLTLLMAMSKVPSVVSVAVTDRPSGTLVYVALRDMADEEIAYERLAEVQAELGAIPIKVICVPLSDLDRLEFSQTARLYSF